MGEVIQRTNVEMRKKLPDGNYRVEYPITLAKNIEIEDADNVFTTTNVEGALTELFTNVGNAKELIAGDLTDMRVQASDAETFAELSNKIRKVRAISSTSKYTTYELMTRYGFDPIRALHLAP